MLTDQAYHSVTATDEFRNLEWMRRKTAHDEAQALYSAELRGEQRGEQRSDAKWQDVVADKDALIAELMAKLGM